MNSRDFAKAIIHLRPTAEFSFQETDYSTIKWDVLDGDAPTLKEIEEADKFLKQQAADAEKIALEKKRAAEAKLVALGLTVDDLKALGLA